MNLLNDRQSLSSDQQLEISQSKMQGSYIVIFLSPSRLVHFLREVAPFLALRLNTRQSGILLPGAGRVMSLYADSWFLPHFIFALLCCAQSHPILCSPMDCSLPGCSVRRVSQARILERMSILTPGDLPNPGIKPVSLESLALTGGFFTTNCTWNLSVSPDKSFPFSLQATS